MNCFKYLPLVAMTALFCEEEQHSLWYYHPLHVGAQTVQICDAECHNIRPNGHHHPKGHVSFQKTNAFTSMMLPVSRYHIFFPEVQFNYVTFDWDKNTKFDEKNFYYMQFDVLYYCTALDNWKWVMRFDYNLQIDHFAEPSLYSLYHSLVWGTHEINPRWHYHIGFLTYWGLEGFDVYPIIGFDYIPNPHWLFQAVFPINYSIEYKIADWTIAAKVHPLKERLRTGSDEPQPRSIFSYSSIGAELNIRYELILKFFAEAYCGYNIGGCFYIKNRWGKQAQYSNFYGALYYGGALNYGF